MLFQFKRISSVALIATLLAACYLGLLQLGLSPQARMLALLGTGALASVLVAYGFFLAVERRFIHQR